MKIELKSFFIGFGLSICLILAGCQGPQIAYYLYSKDRKQFEGVKADGSDDIIPIDDDRADKLACTTLEGWQIQQKWMNDHCH